MQFDGIRWSQGIMDLNLNQDPQGKNIRLNAIYCHFSILFFALTHILCCESFGGYVPFL